MIIIAIKKSIKMLYIFLYIFFKKKKKSYTSIYMDKFFEYSRVKFFSKICLFSKIVFDNNEIKLLNIIKLKK